MKQLLEETQILSKLTHPNIMQIYEVFDNKSHFYIVSEYCQGGELFDALNNIGNFSENDAAYIIKQLLSAICYCHQNHVVHRDLKPENILLDEKSNDLTIKIIDWGTAKTLNKSERLHAADGTPYYIAPEVLKEDYDEKCDIWSVGVITYLTLCGYPPFNGETDEEIYDAVESGVYEFPAEEWDHISKEAKDLISKMLVLDPNKRISALDALDHVWFKKFGNSHQGKSDTKVAKKVLDNMKKFKKNRKLEQATIGFIANQLISKEDRKELMKQFQEWDKNGDGVLNREEILEGYKKTFGEVDESEIDNIIASVDLDGNGVIDYNEFVSCAMNKEKIINEKNLKICFDTFDTDGSGDISVDELMNIFNKSSKQEADKEVFEKMLKEVDTNGDGEISFEEFKNIIFKFFK